MEEYQKVTNGLFICGLPGIAAAVANENVDMILDLRAEAGEGDYEVNVERYNVPLTDGAQNQTELLRKAIEYATEAYREGKQVLLH